MPDDSKDDSMPASHPNIMLGRSDLHYHRSFNLITWHPRGVLDDVLLDEIEAWLWTLETASPQFERFVDLSQLTEIAVRVNHVFEFARKRARHLAEAPRMKSALFCEDWVGFAIARIYQDLMAETPLQVRAFRDRKQAATWLGVPVDALKPTQEPLPPS